ncbi:MAG: branched-chain amino acid aminotransferase [Spirochaetota bacterium]
MSNINWDNLGFEINPAEKMFVSHYKNGKWEQGDVVDYGPIPLYPSAVVLNYGQGVFEGMKAYRTRENRIAMFRPYDNARRIKEGCMRLCIPPLQEDFFVDSIHTLLKENKQYIPPYGKGDLYIRPVVFGSGQMLGVRPATEYTFAIFMSPVGPYFREGFSGIKLEVRTDYHRAPCFGTGGVKAVGNYATSLLPREVVKENGYHEVLYLDSRTSTYIEEVGSANFFMLKDGVVSTPRLGGSVLPGITRDSVLTIARDRFNLIPQERDIRYDEAFSADELFCTGTAAVITPIAAVTCGSKEYTIGDGKPGPMTRKLYQELKAIQVGEKSSNYGWFYPVE